MITVVLSTSFILLFPLLKSSGRHRIAAAWCRSILRWLKLSCGISYTVEGAENLNRCPTVYLANHQSSFEAILFYQLICPVSPILKKELLQIPFWGWALRLVKPVAIDRSKPREAARSLMAQGDAMLKEGNSIIIFPEGSRSEPGLSADSPEVAPHWLLLRKFPSCLLCIIRDTRGLPIASSSCRALSR